MRRRSSPTAEPAPLSLKEISQRAENFEYSDLVPLRFWLRTAATLIKEVS